jgi:hypothetical protein
MHPHEEALFKRFVAYPRRKRLLTLLADPKKRQKLLNELYHFHDLDPRFAHRIAPREQFAEKIYAVLRSKGAPASCYVMSDDADLDGRDMDLREALERTVGQGGGTFLSCLPGQLAYYEGEEPNERYILERLPTSSQGAGPTSG